MIIEIDTEKLVNHGFTADEFLFLSMLSRDLDSSDLKLIIDREKLQTNGWSSKANAKAKSRYLKYIGKDKQKHEHVIECLQRELLLRKRGNNLGFMQQLETWINNHTWEKYSDLSDGESKSTTESSGSESRITRQL